MRRAIRNNRDRDIKIRQDVIDKCLGTVAADIATDSIEHCKGSNRLSQLALAQITVRRLKQRH